MDPIITNNAPFGIVVWQPVHQDETLTAAAPVTWAAGTLLGRVTASGKLTAYESGNADGSETPIAVLQTEVVFTVAGDKVDRPIISGRVRRGDLVAHGVGAISDGEADALRSMTIIPQDVAQLGELDNQ
mgnify:CR=1 FL=1